MNNFYQNTSYKCQKTIDSIHEKQVNIINTAKNIQKVLQVLNASKIKRTTHIDEFLRKNFVLICDEIYSTMDYLGYIIYSYQKETGYIRGNYTGSHFNTILTNYINLNSRKNYGIYSIKKFTLQLDDIKNWYPPIHCIRSKETHYNMGHIIDSNGTIIYSNDVEYGEYPKCTFNLTDTLKICLKFQNNVNFIITLINNYFLKSKYIK